MKTLVSLSVVACMVAGLGACATDEFGNPRRMTRAEKGVLTGAASGAVLGYLVKKDKRKKGALIGAVGGAIAGGLVGKYMDDQRRDFEQVLAPEVGAGAIQIAKAENNVLVVTMTEQSAFDFDSATIKPSYHGTMGKIAKVVNRYGKTHLTIVGHTDSTGSSKYNQSLSERRAGAVNDYLRGKGVAHQRLDYLGRGENEPRASNSTESGRRLNRRVEIVIEPVVAES